MTFGPGRILEIMVRVCLTVLALAAALPAGAQQLTLDIQDGLVTLSATNVPVRQILDEWAKVGGTRVVGAERITGAPLTLRLEAVPEGKALDIVLRGAAGYMAAARAVPGIGRSSYDRILVLATSTPPAGGGADRTSQGGPAARGFGVPPQINPGGLMNGSDQTNPRDLLDIPDNVEVTDTELREMAGQPPVNPFANAFGQPGASPFGQPQPPIAQPFQQGGSFFQPLQPPPQDAPVAPQGFFGAGGSAVPGMIQPPPPQPGQVQPQGTRPRPPG